MVDAKLIQAELDAYVEARQRVLQIEKNYDAMRAKGGELAARQWGNACQKQNKAETKLLAAIKRHTDSQTDQPGE